ncbi:hypothetical protein [Zhaonella formicivorans]|nr:hypothetical protein [Zhaonella formicivorans]
MPETIFDGTCQTKQEELAELDLSASGQPVKSPREVKTWKSCGKHQIDI